MKNATYYPDPIAERLRRAVVRAKREKAARGVELVAADFEQMARQASPDEFENIKTLLRERAAAINGQKPAEIPAFRYEDVYPRLEAGKYVLALELRQLQEDPELIVRVGLRDCLWQFSDELPDVPTATWVFRAAADENGFFWVHLEDGTRCTSGQIVDSALETLSKFLEADLLGLFS